MSSKKNTQQLYESFVATMRKKADVEYSIGVLSWDKEVNLPDKGAAFRSQQVATLSGIAHEIFTDKAFGDTLENLVAKNGALNSKQKKNVKLTLKEYQRSKKLSKDFVIKKSQAISAAYHAWIKAREANDYQAVSYTHLTLPTKA